MKILKDDLKFLLKFLKSVPIFIPKDVLINTAGISKIPCGNNLQMIKIPSEAIDLFITNPKTYPFTIKAREGIIPKKIPKIIPKKDT